MEAPNGGRSSRRGRGWAETRRILKTFAVLLIFFSKWVKLFYDFQRQFLATALVLPLPLSPSLFLSLFLFSPLLILSSVQRRHVHLARLIFSLDLVVFPHREFRLSSPPAHTNFSTCVETFLIELAPAAPTCWLSIYLEIRVKRHSNFLWSYFSKVFSLTYYIITYYMC